MIYSYLLLIAGAALIGWKLGLLTRSGSFMAFMTGAAIAWGFGFKGLIMLGLFFVSSSLWSRIGQSRKKQLEEMLEKGSRRDGIQVLANGGVPAVIALVHGWLPGQEALILFLVSIAAANSDTWGSELGVLSKSKPLSILTFKRVERGTSGAVSLFGTICSAAGAAFIASAALLLFDLPMSSAVVAAGFGFLGSLFDTLIGAFIQPQYVCRSCGIQTERTVHCGEAAQRQKGLGFLDNDSVNLLSIVLASAACFTFLKIWL
ncbi:DUF92 domain-containing protein [Peribacillus sp. SCS-37]|uniref:DUF92 domain-containing protein n=1 Tax=Paraperibacillus esterisolvens TaxID=3115296 RepID=UPI0039067552